MNLSKVILGTVQFGMPYGINNSTGQPTAAEVSGMLDIAWEHGLRELDCADVYGDSQEIIGNYLLTSGRKFSINTKFKVGGEADITTQLEDTLRSLGIEKINVYFFHRFSDTIDHPGVIEALTQLKRSGRINQTGVSIYTNDEFAMCIDNPAIDVIQLPFNLLDNYTKRGALIRQAKAKGKTLHVRSVFLQGLFFKDPATLPSRLEPLSKYIWQLSKIATRHSLSMYDLALGYALSIEEIDKVIIGVDSRRQLEMNLAIKKPKDETSMREAIDDIQVAEESLLYPINWK